MNRTSDTATNERNIPNIASFRSVMIISIVSVSGRCNVSSSRFVSIAAAILRNTSRVFLALRFGCGCDDDLLFLVEVLLSKDDDDDDDDDLEYFGFSTSRDDGSPPSLPVLSEDEENVNNRRFTSDATPPNIDTASTVNVLFIPRLLTFRSSIISFSFVLDSSKNELRSCCCCCFFFDILWLITLC